ncbi:MAG: hypothetical protein FJ386_04475 [Verrucomicrobia bacterium]|nr:hypothetical protein [Verrucomicrobiota bacterium]
MKRIAASIGFSLLALTACKKEPQPATPPLVTARPPKAAATPVAPQPAPVAAQDTGMDPSLGVLAEVSPGEMSNTSLLTLGLQEFMSEKGRLPADMKELSKYLRYRVEPIPPAGTKFVFDAKNKQVRIVRQ